MDNARRTPPFAGPHLTRRTLLEGAAALGLAVAGSQAWPSDSSPRARAMRGPGREDWRAFNRTIQTATQVFGIVGTAVAIVNGAGTVCQCKPA
jgi:hypothetical protein